MSCPGCRWDRVHLASAEGEKVSRLEVRLDRCGRWPGLFWWSTWPSPALSPGPLQLLSSLRCIRRPLWVGGLGRARLQWRARPFLQLSRHKTVSIPFPSRPSGTVGPVSLQWCTRSFLHSAFCFYHYFFFSLTPCNYQPCASS